MTGVGKFGNFCSFSLTCNIWTKQVEHEGTVYLVSFWLCYFIHTYMAKEKDKV